ncbi:MAG: hypothetical protein E7384_02660 [Ruminococcaceae bacterium]|nr:hypothetical protein [Oscillospiraceae bacterium]
MNKFRITKERSYDIICCIVMILFALAILLIFSRETSPLFGSAFHKMDSIQYKSAGAGILDGVVPFKDSFHQKGVSFFYIEALGEFLCRILNDNRLGTFIIQFMNFVASLCFMFSTAKMLLKKVCNKPGLARGISLLSICPAMYLFVSTFMPGNYTEEFSILFNLISLWLCAKYIIKIEEGNSDTYIHKPIYAFVHALMFSFAFWIRPNNCIGVCTVVAFIVVFLIIKKQYKNLFQNAGMFLLGFACSTLLFLSYYIFNGALADVWYCQFAVNVGYVSANSKIFVEILIPLFLCILYGLYMLLIKKSDFILALLCEISSVCMLLMYLILGSQYAHYTMFIMLPVFIFTLLVIRNVEINSFKRIFSLHILIPFVLFLGASYVHYNIIYDGTYRSLKGIAAIQSGEISGEADSERIGKVLSDVIPDESKDNIYIYPPNFDSHQIYYYSGAYSFYKYANPGWYEYMGAVNSSNEFYTELFNNSPEYIVVNECITEIEDYEYSQRTELFMEENYAPWYEGDGFKVLKYVNK